MRPPPTAKHTSLSRYSAILLDLNSTFMFGEDRFGPDQDYFATYRAIGGDALDATAVRSAVEECLEHLKRVYEDSARVDSFPSVSEVLEERTATDRLALEERRRIERVIACHEVGRIPAPYAEAVRALRRRHRLGIVSNIWSTRELYVRELKRAGVLHLFDTLVFSSDGSSMKPSARLFERALSELGVRAGEAVVVGDSLRCDIGGARAAGLASVWIDRHGSGVPTGLPRPEYVVRDLRDLVESHV